MIALLVVTAVLVIVVVSSVLLGGGAIRRQRAELARIERTKRAAERELHNISRRAVAEMLTIARYANPEDDRWTA